MAPQPTPAPYPTEPPLPTPPIGDPVPGDVTTTPEPAPPPTPYTQLREPGEWRPRSVFGNAVLVGGGIGDFTSETARGATSLGGDWGLRLVSGTRSVLGGELGYVGGANPLDSTATTDDYLLSNGVQGAVRVGIPIALRSALIAPFAFGGIGWTRYDLVNDGPEGGDLVSLDDNQFVIPMGVGIAAGFRGFLAEARGSYRQAYDEEVFGGADMSTWALTLNLGGEF
jgi:hypothetical protein